MIKSVRNNYNVNFKSSKGDVNEVSKFSPNVQEFINTVIKKPPLKDHLEALDFHGIGLSVVALPNGKGVDDKIYLRYHPNDEDVKNIAMDLTDAASRKVETIEDAQLLFNDAVQRAWKFVLKYAKEFYNLKLN